MMIEYVNSFACLVLMGFSLPVAMTMGNRGLWPQRLALVAVQFGLFLQMTNPWVGWVPEATWTGVYLNAAAAVLLTIWWPRAWIFVRCYLGPIDLTHKRRRADVPFPPTLKGAP